MNLPFNPKRGGPSPITLADRARAAGQWELAARHYRSALERNPDRAPIWVQYGHALKESGRHAQAEAAYRRAVAYAPTLADTHLQLGHVLKLAGDRDAAKTAYLRALALDPQLSAAREELARLGWDERNAAELQTALATLAAEAPRRRGRRSRIARADEARDAALWGVAARLYREALDRNPRNPPIWVQYGHALKEDGKVPEAEAAYRRALALDPRAADIHLQLGHALKLQGKTEAAQSAYLRAFVLDPALSEAVPELEELGWSQAEIFQLHFALAADQQTPERVGIELTSAYQLSREVLNPLTQEDVFDREFYLARYPDIQRANLNPLSHFIHQGWKEGRDPSPKFSTNYYLAQNPDVRDSGINPLLHYVTAGKSEGRKGSPAFWVNNLGRLPFDLNDDNPMLYLPVKLGCGAIHQSGSRPRLAVHIHVFYVDSFNEINTYLNSIPEPFDLYISTDDQSKSADITTLLSPTGIPLSVEIRIVPNRGRDVAPLLISFGDIFYQYEYLLHLHTKKTLQNPAIGHLWRRHLLDHLLRDSAYVRAIFNLLDAEDSCGLLFPPAPEEIAFLANWGKNYEIACSYLAQISLPPPETDNRRLVFPVGTMFWCRPAALRSLLDSRLTYEDFPPEPLAEDGTLAHAIERILPHIVRQAGFHERVVGPLPAHKMAAPRSAVTLSVVIPAYNADKWLHQAVQSILMQDLTQYSVELIVVDNGSTDNTRNISEFYAQSYENISCVYETERGAGSARNLGIATARGRFIMFVDADDVLEITAIEHLLRIAINTNAEIVTSQLCTFTETEVGTVSPVFKNGLLHMRRIVSGVETPANNSIELHNIEALFEDFGPCAKIYRTGFLRDHEIYFPTGTNYEDNLFVYSAYLAASIIALEARPVYFYRKYLSALGSTQSTSSMHKAMADQINVLHMILDKLRSTPAYSPFILNLISRKIATKISWLVPVGGEVPLGLVQNSAELSRLFDRIELEDILPQWADEGERATLHRLQQLVRTTRPGSLTV